MRRLAVAAALVLSAIPWHSARACSIAFSQPEVVLPAEGADDVPTNVMVWANLSFGVVETPTERAVFVAADGTVIEATVRVLADEVLVVRPVADLEPHTQYVVRACTFAECPVELRQFSTGAGPSSEPPDVPVEHGRDLDVDRRVGLCGGVSRTIELDLEFDGVLVVDIGLPQFDEETLQGDVDVLATGDDDALVIDREALSVGSDRLDARMGVFDEAGTFSGWVELERLDFTGCACSSAGERGGAGLGWLCVVLAACRRRR